jgi:hypothetical protein
MKRFVFPVAAAVVTIVLFLGGLEAIATAYLYATTGTYVPARQRFASTTNTFVQDVTRAEDCAYVDAMFPHPYVAFVHHGNPPCGMADVNNVGLFGADFPSTRSEDRFVVLLTGGSVAAQFANPAPGGRASYLEQMLNERYVSPNGRPFQVLNGGGGAWKQPQQTILFLLYADAVDALVTLDGFNEHYMLQSGFRFEYPAANFHAVNPLASQRFDDIVARWTVGRLREAAARNALLSRSQAAYSLIAAAQDYVARRAERRPAPKTTIESLFMLPPDWPQDRRTSWAIEQYRKYIRAMHAIAATHEVRTAFFVQPVPAIGKQLTEDERRVVGDLGYRDVYRNLAGQLLSLTAEGVPVVSLLDVFQDDRSTVYADPVHLARNADGGSPGYALMSDRMAAELGRLWKLTPRNH